MCHFAKKRSFKKAKCILKLAYESLPDSRTPTLRITSISELGPK